MEWIIVDLQAIYKAAEGANASVRRNAVVLTMGWRNDIIEKLHSYS
jgi:hypothetical protein